MNGKEVLVQMKNKKKNNMNLLIIIALLVFCIIGVICVSKFINKKQDYTFSKPNKYSDTNFNLNIIKTVNSSIDNNNYLISPYSIEFALNMLREASAGNTLKEINSVVTKRTIPDLSNAEKIGVANGIFIKNDYKNNIKKDFINTLKKDYKSEIIYDDFKTPKVINDWVKEKTNKMIPSILDEISKDFILGIANALAIDVEWEIPFEKDNTKKEYFTLEDGKKIKTKMMHNSYTRSVKYFKDSKKEGVIIPYKSEKNDKYNLELIAFLPKKGVKDFIENMKEEDLDIKEDIIDDSKNLKVNLSLPKFEYSFDLENFKDILITMGIKDVFNSGKADLSNAIDSSIKAYVSQAIHKTKIEVSEKGTKAAATTYFGVEKSSVAYEPESKIININFDKPFIYMIKETNTNELMFFGVLYNPQQK